MVRTRATSANSATSRLQQQVVVAPWAIALVTGSTFLVWRFHVLSQLPVWDGAMGMTPAAVALESMDFDVGRLLRLPDFRAGGPNLHSLSMWTWLVAGSIRLFGSYLDALPFLHLISILLVGLVAAGVFRIILGFGGSRLLALIGAAGSVLFPPMVVQASDVYLDLPLAVALTWSFVYLFEDRFGPALMFATLAAAVKPSAVIAIPPMAVVIAMRGPNRVRRLLLLAIPAAVATVPLLVDVSLHRRSEGPLDATPFLTTLEYIGSMPVLVVLMLTVAGVALSTYTRNVRSRLHPGVRSLVLGSVAFPVSFLYFFLLNPFITKGIVGLPRYTTMFLPLTIVGLLIGIKYVLSDRASVMLGLAVVGVFILNMHGGLEPGSQNRYPLSERSLKYEAHLAVQQEAFATFEDLAQEMPSYYDHFSHFRIEYPETGWLKRPVLEGTSAYRNPSIGPWSLPEMPDRFVMLFENDWFGGLRLMTLRDAAIEDPDWEVDVSVFSRGEYRNEVVVVTRVETNAAPATQVSPPQRSVS